MNWTSLGDFFHMGGYGVYVWGSYGAALLLFAAEILQLRARRRTLLRRLDRMQRTPTETESDESPT